MKIFTAVQTQWNEFYSATTKYLSSMLGKDGRYGPSNIFGQIYTILNGVMQNLMLYIEDAFTEQNVYTAERKKSIYSLARLSGYNPSLGTSSRCSIKLTYKSEAAIESNIVLIPNKTKIRSNQTGLTYNIILPQETCVFNLLENTHTKHMSIVEGEFYKSTYTSEGGALYTININTSTDIDIDYFSVYVNGEEWEKVESLYDMQADGKEYYIQTSLSKGVDIVFGNGQYGRVLKDGDTIDIEYLSHNGEIGNINPDDDITFTFVDSIMDPTGNAIDGNVYFNIELEDREGITSGTYSEDLENVKKMIGYNSRAMVLADAKNYKIFLNRFSFVGYNRCWSEPGSLVVNALIMRDYKQLCENGSDYFSLNESDFKLNNNQKESIKEAITESGQQIGGTILNIIDPKLKKYAMFVYLKMKDNVVYDKDIINNQIKNLVGNFFGNVQSDMYIPKSDIIHLLKSEIPQIDGIDLYIISEDNELAKINGNYIEETYSYNPSTMTYDISTRTVNCPSGTDPHIGLDGHGNIYLDNDMYFPVLMGNWSYKIDGSETTTINVMDPVQIIYQ